MKQSLTPNVKNENVFLLKTGCEGINKRNIFIVCFILLVSIIILTNQLIGSKTYSGLTAFKAALDTRPFSTCSCETVHDLINSPLPITLHDNVDVTAFEQSGCFAIDSKKLGLYRIVHERNFAHVICNGTQKKFLPDKDIHTALASIPGSGNTWVRHLLEDLTGIYTGSVYGSSRIDQVFKGEHTTDDVVAIKTHYLHRFEKEVKGVKFQRAIIIVRDIFDATLAAHNLANMRNKTGILPKDQFKKEDFMSRLLPKFSKMNMCVKWIQNFDGDIFVLFYENLKKDLLNSLTKLAAFCQSEVTLKRLWCTLQNQEGSYHRGKKPEWMSRKVLLDDELESKVSKWMDEVKIAT